MARPRNMQSQQQPISSNPFRAWRDQRKLKMQQAADQAAQEVSNVMAENVNTIITILGSVNFIDSPLLLTEPTKIRDIEMFIDTLKLMLMDVPATNTDLRDLDQRIILMAHHLVEAIQEGQVERAVQTCYGLRVAIENIRKNVPQTRKELTRDFIKRRVEFLEQYILSIEEARGLDILNKAISDRNERIEKWTEMYEAERKKLENDLRDEKVGAATLLKYMREHDTPAERKKWTADMHTLNWRLTELAIQTQVIDFAKEKNLIDMQLCSVRQGQLNNIQSILANGVDETDPNLQEKFNEAMQKATDEMFEADQELDKALEDFQKMDTILADIRNAPGQERFRRIAREESERQLKEIIERTQQHNVGSSGGMTIKESEHLDVIHEMGLTSLNEEKETEQQVEEIEAEVEVLTE